MLTTIALFLSLLKLICWGRRWRGGNTEGLGDSGGQGKEGGTAPPGSFSIPLKRPPPGKGPGEKRHSSHCQTLCRLVSLIPTRFLGTQPTTPSPLLSWSEAAVRAGTAQSRNNPLWSLQSRGDPDPGNDQKGGRGASQETLP